MTEPKVNEEGRRSWRPEPRGDQDVGNHAEVPAMRYEDAASQGKDVENRELGRQLIATFAAYKPGDRFVLQWRMFPNADSPMSTKTVAAVVAVAADSRHRHGAPLVSGDVGRS